MQGTTAAASGAAVLGRLAAAGVFVPLAAALYWGWRHRAESYLTAESGTGYLLGIVGGSMMLLLLLYPLRKNARFMRRAGPIGWWFRMHMLFGLLGPSAILYHANFQLGSLNSNVALFCMLLVAASGIVGRYFYTQIHFGLYGSRATLRELRDIAAYRKGQLADALGGAGELGLQLRQLEQEAHTAGRNLLHSAFRLMRFGLTGGWRHWQLRRAMQRALAAAALREGWEPGHARRVRREAHRYLRLYLATARKVAGLAFYERLFALWHAIHLPFFLMMVVSGVVHVVAVHMY
jgi:hypothetical protein